jgi:hypothetical protein
MKKLSYYLMFLPLLCLVVSCNEKEKPTPKQPDLEVSLNTLEFGYDEARVEKIVTVTGVETFELSVVYADPDKTDWLDAQKIASTVSVAVLDRNMDSEEQPRKATITVTAGEQSKKIEVTQLAYIETDFSIGLPEKLLFAPSGNLTQTITATSKVTPLTVSKTADWVTAATVDGLEITITLSENTTTEPRETTIAVKNRGTAEGEEATLEIFQYGKPSDDISGEWSWKSLNFSGSNAESIAAAVDISGTATVTADTGGYKITGIKGEGGQIFKDLLAANPDAMPTMSISQTSDGLFVGMYDDVINIGSPRAPNNITVDLWLSAGNAPSQKYVFGAILAEAEDPSAGNYILDADIEIARSLETIDGVLSEVLTFPTSRTEDSILTYGYYTFTNAGMATYLDLHRNLVLTRPLGGGNN